jgi:glycosyltransferase involved in cell wall biosynthesis
MRIAFDLRRIKNLGIGRYMKYLVEAVVKEAPEHEYLLIMASGTEEMISASEARVTRVVCNARYYSVTEQIVLPRLLKRHAVDIFHSPHFLVPLRSPCPVVATVHDVVHIVCKDDLRSTPARIYARVMMKACAHATDRIITDSEFSKQDIVRVLDVAAEKIDIVYPGVTAMGVAEHEKQDIAAVRERFGIVEDTILYAGIYRRRKNHTALLKAFAELIRRGVRAQLVIAGPMDGHETELQSVAANLGIAGRVVFTGLVSDDELRALYGIARVYACPSLYEGFGFTVLEAMSSGVPVVAAPYTCLPEVGGKAALYADPNNPAEFAEALSLALNDSELRQRLIAGGYQNLGRFVWQRAARETLDVYAQVVGTPIPECVATT